jgi:hypothetical protein
MHPQQGARMATWALRMCLLRSISGGYAWRGWPRGRTTCRGGQRTTRKRECVRASVCAGVAAVVDRGWPRCVHCACRNPGRLALVWRVVSLHERGLGQQAWSICPATPATLDVVRWPPPGTFLAHTSQYRSQTAPSLRPSPPVQRVCCAGIAVAGIPRRTLGSLPSTLLHS